MTAPGFDPPEKSWDHVYSATEFVPQHPEVLDALATDFDGAHQSTSEVARMLGAVELSRWKGAAADVFLGYVHELASYVRTTRDVSADAADRVRAAGSGLRTALDAADKAVVDIEAAQKRHEEHAGDNLLEKLQHLPDTISIDHDFDAAYARGCDANDDARQALEKLAAALDHADATLAGLRAPEPPSTDLAILLHVVPESQRELLDSLFGPVRKAIDDEGATDAAEQALTDAQSAAIGDDDAKRAYLAKLAGLSPAEVRYVLDHLDEDDVAALFDGLDPTEDRNVYNAIAAVAPAELLARLGDTDPHHYWHPFTGDGGPFDWNVPDGVPGQVPDGSTDNLQQGMLGDCHVLSSLAAAERADPGVLARNVHANVNGTFTVTLYEDGKAFQVVVTPEVPFTINSDGTPGDGAFTHGSDATDQTWNSTSTLYQIYEKALAQTWGELDPNGDGRSGYDGMNGGWPHNDLPLITGKGAHGTDSDDMSPADLRAAYEQHRPIAVNSLPEGDADDNSLYDDDGVHQMIAGHSYYVVGVEGEGDDTTVIVANPWGSGLPGTGTVTLTWDEFQHGTSSVDVGD